MSYQEVVHSDRTEETGVTKLQHSPESPNEHPQECAPLRREDTALLVLAGGVSKAHAARSVPAKIVARRVERYQAEGRAGMTDRSFRPLAMPAIEAGCRTARGVVATATMNRVTPPVLWVHGLACAVGIHY